MKLLAACSMCLGINLAKGLLPQLPTSHSSAISRHWRIKYSLYMHRIEWSPSLEAVCSTSATSVERVLPKVLQQFRFQYSKVSGKFSRNYAHYTGYTRKELCISPSMRCLSEPVNTPKYSPLSCTIAAKVVATQNCIVCRFMVMLHTGT